MEESGGIFGMYIILAKEMFSLNFPSNVILWLFFFWGLKQVYFVLENKCLPSSLLGWSLFIFMCYLLTPGIGCFIWKFFNSEPDLSDDDEDEDEDEEDNKSEVDKVIDSFYKKR